ncbi:tetratricopeptide repeat protein [Pseudomonadota bacterium]
MKRLLIATISLFIIAGGTFWFLGSDPSFDTEALKSVGRTASKFQETLPKADAGDAKAQFEIAKMYETGDGTAKEMALAVKWYMKAADQGNPAAKFQLAWMYANGIGVRQDYFTAAKYYRLAATFDNHTEAQFRMGELHFNGRGVEHDYGKAIKYYNQAASKGHAAAQYLLGSMYIEGWGIKKDLIKAYIWLKLAQDKRAEALAVNRKYDPVKKMQQLLPQMTKFQLSEAEKRLAAMSAR